MKAGLLNEVIRIEKPVTNRDEYGADSKIWETQVAKTKASVTFNSGNRVNENNEIIYAYQVTFTIRIYHQINEEMRIIWKNKKYRILSLEENKQRQNITIRTELINE